MERQTYNALVVLLLVGVIGLCQGTRIFSNGNANATTMATTMVTGNVTDVTVITELTDVTTLAPNATTVMTMTAITEEMATTGNFSTTEVTTEGYITTPHPTHNPNKPPIGTWTIKDDKNKTCMKMQLGVRFTIYFTNTSNQVDVAIIDAPLSAYPVGKCNSGNPGREFKLHLFNDGSIEFFYVSLVFNGSSTYKLTKIGSFFTTDARLFKNPKYPFQQSWQSSGSNNLLNNSVPQEKSFTCGHTLSFPGVYVTLYDVKFMPYADKAKGDFGESVTCKNADNGYGLNSWEAILVIVAILVVIALIAVGVVLGYRKYKRSKADDRNALIQGP